VEARQQISPGGKPSGHWNGKEGQSIFQKGMKSDHVGAPFPAMMRFISSLPVRIELFLWQILPGHQRVKGKVLNYPAGVAA
jgi:hypothetical protein